MLTTSPTRIIEYVPKEVRDRGERSPYFRIRTPSGKQRTRFFSAFRGAAGDTVDVDFGVLVTSMVESCLVGWSGLTYDDETDPVNFGKPVPFDTADKLAPLSQDIIAELFRFIQSGCRLAPEDVVPLGSPPRSSSVSSAEVDTVSSARAT